MKIAFAADLHLRGKDLAAAAAQLAALVDECLARRVSLVAVAGDVFDRPGIGDNHASTGAIAAVAIAAVKRLTDGGIDVLMIPGNHDQAGAGSADALHVFDGMERVYVWRDKTSVIGLGDDYVLVAVPWSWGGENAEHIIADVIQRNRHSVALPGDVVVNNKIILLAHIQVTGARMSGSFCCEAAPGKWQVSREFLESLPVDHIALGDFHSRQDLTGGRGGYIGALRQCNFGEEGNAAGFEIYDTETGAVEWIELDAAPKHLTAIVREGGLSTARNILDMSGGQRCAMMADACDLNTNIRVRFDGVTPDPVEVRKLEAAGVQIEQVIEREERVRRAEVAPGILQDRHGLIRLWAGVQNPPVDGARLERAIVAHDRLFADKPVPEPRTAVSTAADTDPF